MFCFKNLIEYCFGVRDTYVQCDIKIMDSIFLFHTFVHHTQSLRRLILGWKTKMNWKMSFNISGEFRVSSYFQILILYSIFHRHLTRFIYCIILFLSLSLATKGDLLHILRFCFLHQFH